MSITFSSQATQALAYKLEQLHAQLTNLRLGEKDELLQTQRFAGDLADELQQFSLHSEQQSEPDQAGISSERDKD